MELPKTVVKASRKSPKNMIIYGPPKIGKTTVLSQLDNCLIIDLEQGSDMIDALKITCRKFTKEKTGKKPITNINLVRI